MPEPEEEEEEEAEEGGGLGSMVPSGATGTRTC